MSINTRPVLVTGATGNLGAAVVEAFLARGRPVIAVGSRLESLARAFAEPPQGLALVAADLAHPETGTPMLRKAVEHAGGVGSLVAVAGGFRMGEKVDAVGEGALAAMMAINVTTFLTAVAAVMPSMVAAGSGRIVAVGALAGQKGGARMSAYSASKAALLRLVESLAAENASRGITANAVLPSIIDTPENRAAMPDADVSKWVAPASLAEVIAFLASDEAEAVTGALVPVTGRG